MRKFPGTWKEPQSREPSPEERAIQEEEGDSLVAPLFDDAVLDKTWRRMKRWKPHLYVVLRAYIEALELRDERSRYAHGLYRGFYAEWARRLGVTENTVRYRLKAATRWFVKHL